MTTRATCKHLQCAAAGVFLFFFLISTQLGPTESRSISDDQGFFSAPILKRNTWWSKKSLDAMETIPQTSFDSDASQFGQCQGIIDVYTCYVDRCVQSYVTCARQAGTDELFSACKMLHKMCASSCSGREQTDFLRLWWKRSPQANRHATIQLRKSKRSFFILITFFSRWVDRWLLKATFVKTLAIIHATYTCFFFLNMSRAQKNVQWRL